MIVFLAFVFMIMPIVVEYICDRAESRNASSPTASPEPLEPAPVDLVFTDSRDVERCAMESRLARELLDGTLDRGRYQTEMAALAADAASPRLPGDPRGHVV